MQRDKQEMGRKRASRLLRIFAPFTILLAGLLFLNLQIEGGSLFQPSPTQEAAGPSEPATQVPTVPPQEVNGRPAPIATAIVNATESAVAVPEATPSPLPTLLPGDVATLTGPPAGSQFSLSSPLAFYWYSDRQLPEDQLFGVFLAGESGETLVGELSESNLGSGYQVHVLPENFDMPAGDYYWHVGLVQNPGDSLVGISEQRGIRLVEMEK